MKTTRTLRASVGSAFALALAVGLAGCTGIADNPTLESIHQPVVERTNYTLDVATGPGGLSLPEQRRLAGWFDAMDLRYGDRISIDDPLASPATRASVQAVASRHGLLLSDDAPVTPGYVNAGSARVIVTRASAHVPGCPDWRTTTDFNPKNATSSSFGCAVNGNLAAMVANPEHLVRGDDATGDTVVMSSTKAIETYRETKPTGSEGLKTNSTGGGGGK
jgi:pilus assembly protein CpaD